VRLFEFKNDDLILRTEVDFDSVDFVFFDDPVEYFDLTEVDSRVSSFEQLKYYAEVFLYLNPDVDYNLFRGIFRYMGSRESGKSIRTYSKARIDDMISDVYNNPKVPFCRRKRRVIFNPESVLSKEKKLSITSSLISRSVVFTKQDILEAIDYLSRSMVRITNDSISKHLSCSEKTIRRLLDDSTRDYIKTLNKTIKKEKMVADIIEWIDVLSDSGDKIKIRKLKELTKCRDYDAIKEAISRYEKGF